MNFTTFVQEIGRISRYPHTETFIEKVASEKVASEEVASERFMVKMIGSGPKRKKLMAGASRWQFFVPASKATCRPSTNLSVFRRM